MSGNAIWVHEGSTDAVSGETILGALASGKSYDGVISGAAQQTLLLLPSPAAVNEASVIWLGTSIGMICSWDSSQDL